MYSCLETAPAPAPAPTEAERATVRAYAQRLQLGCDDAPGILRSDVREPLPHQARAVQRLARSAHGSLILVHAAGLGKTATAVQAIAAEHLVLAKRREQLKVLIVAPACVFFQWEETVYEWLTLVCEDVFISNTRANVRVEGVQRAKVVLLSRDTVSALAKEEPDHPLFRTQWALLIVDEVHLSRRVETRIGGALAALAANARKKLALSATPVPHGVADLVGLASVLALPKKWRRKETWEEGGAGAGAGAGAGGACEEFARLFIDKVDESVLRLPPITEQTVDVEFAFAPERVAAYNCIFDEARKARAAIGKCSTAESKNAYKSCLTRLRHFVVSPLLAEVGADAFAADAQLARRAVDEARADGSDALLRALQAQLERLFGDGHERVVVLSESVAALALAGEYLREAGMQLFNYVGTQALQERQAAKAAFASSTRGVLFLSIAAGGVGISLVCAKAAIFFGAFPFSPTDVVQGAKRVHRLGQDQPVIVKYILPTGSIEAAVAEMHKEKMAVIGRVVGGAFVDPSALSAPSGAMKMRLVDRARRLLADGRFPCKGERVNGGRAFLPKKRKEI